MDQPGEAAQRGRHPGGAQRLRVVLALVTERVEAARDDVGRREPREVLGQDRRHSRVGGLRVHASDVVLAEPVHLGLREEEPLGEQLARRALRGHVGDRIDQELEHGPGPAVVHGKLSRHGGQVPARAVAAHGDPLRVGAQLVRSRHRVAERGEGVVDRRRERVLRGEAIVHAQHPRARGAGQHPKRGVVRLEVARHPAAPVVVDEQRAALRGRRLGRRV